MPYFCLPKFKPIAENQETEERRKMKSEPQSPKPKELQLNPNWEQLRQKLRTNGSKKHFSKTPQQKSETESQNSILGKRKERSLNEVSEGSKPNPLIPTSSDTSITDVLAMDCEMVGVSSVGNKDALGRVTLVNKWGNVVYDEHVRPVERVVDFRTQISGIRPRDLRKAKDFNSVQRKVAELLKGRNLVGHALHNDLKALLLSHPKKDIRDTSEYQPFLKEGRSRALRHLSAELLGVEIQNGEHCPIEDARAAMLLYQRNRKQWERSIQDFARLKNKQKKRKLKNKLKGGSADVHNVVVAS